ncbi:MAG: RDD family protein [Bacteroidetes bacterium]|nr:RDD family protein [Bacteroidota bacterium]
MTVIRKKITEIRITKMRTVHYRDDDGDLIRDAEEVEFTRPVNTASGSKRMLHYFVDSVVFSFGIVLLQTTVIFFSDALENIIIIPFFVPIINLICYTFFYFIFENSFQRTPAKFLTGCRVINAYCEKPDAKSILSRSLIRIVPFEALSCFSSSGRGWHDKWSDTWVVDAKEYEELRRLLGMSSEDSSILE